MREEVDSRFGDVAVSSAFCTDPPLAHTHMSVLQILYANPLIHLFVCRLVPVPAP